MEQKFNLVQSLKDAEKSAADVLGIIGTWIAPIPSAYRIFVAAIETLNWNWGMAFILAATIEILGVLSILTALEMWRWNKTRSRAKGERGDEKAPLSIALFIIAIYLFTAISLTTVLEIFPELSIYSNGIFSLLTAVGGGLMAMRYSHQTREAAKAQRLQKRRDARAKSGAKKEKKKKQADLPPAKEPKPKPTTDEERIQQMYVHMMANPYATCKELGEKIGRSSGWVSQKTRKLIDQGDKLKKNGHGWEVIG